MKPVSFSSFVSNVMRTFKRFPGAIIAVITGSVFCIMLSHLPNDQTEMHHWYWNVVMSCYLGMLLLIALSVFAERKSANTTIKLLLQLAGAAIVLVYYFSLTDHYIVISTIRFTLFALGLHCLIAFIPFTKAGEIHDGFWQYN